MCVQFPERHFLGSTLVQELTFAWPPTDMAARQALAAGLAPVLEATQLEGVPLQQPLATLSGGQQRRVALAVALARRPAVLLLDEPLAGLDWRSRAEVADVLRAFPARPWPTTPGDTMRACRGDCRHKISLCKHVRQPALHCFGDGL